MNERLESSPSIPPAQGEVLAIPPFALGSSSLPERVGRYRILSVLGEGGFGQVFLANDDQLNRQVAIKVPHRHSELRPENIADYLAEARTLAGLDHPHIVPVFDIGTTDLGLFYVVSKYIAGSDLASRIKKTRPSFAESSQVVATVADALHYAHDQGVVHRDIKPGNILLDTLGKPYVADFGLALREEDFGRGAGFAGTPAYMSPEQARGEGHRVDGRSDLFSLGVCFYELLTGRRPFQSNILLELLEQIANHEVRPLRQIVNSIPKELERICLKALAPRASERYATGRELAEDLRHFLAECPRPILVAPVPPVDSQPLPTPPSEQRPGRIVPKGLRSFDAHDADFFLDLLPGARDRDGTPEAIRFWKSRIEETDGDKTFSVGLICGPSGCGKSSLVKAGLLPRLACQVIAVYVESTSGETEARLANGLRKRCPSLPVGLGLKEAMAALRRGQGIPSGKKVVIVLDQFEQWLHAKKEEENTELVQALRQCDGVRVQCIVMVRDDFWMAVIRFMRELEIRLVEGHNSASVDLFPVRHAEKVLAAFGRAFGALPEADLSKPIDASLQALVSRLEHLSDQYSELRDGVQKAIQVADVDPEMALTRTRKVLEFVIRDVYERRINEPPGTRPLENLLQRIVKDGYFPDRLDAYANTIRKLGNVGTHAFKEKGTVADVHQSLTQLMPILEWYFVVERPEALAGKQPARSQPARVAGGSSAESKMHKEFLDQAVAGLAQDGKIICVRLALFAEMMKGKAWTPAGLKEVGGTEGVGVTFLEETFSASAAPPAHRYHQKAARGVLKALLPESGTDIKGHMRSYGELLKASGYNSRPKDFDDLVGILDDEIRLITPTDPEGKEGADECTSKAQPGQKFYQLTHDYLVNPLRDWLNHKQTETRRGRAELRLAERVAAWQGKPKSRFLPAWWEWAAIHLFTRSKDWTPQQRKMMRAAGRYHAGRGLILAACLALLAVTTWEGFGRIKAQGLRDRLVNAMTADVPLIIDDMAPYRRWAYPLLQEVNQEAKASADVRKQLHSSLALLPQDPSQVEYLYGRLLDAQPHEIIVIRTALSRHSGDLLDRLWSVVAHPDKGREYQRLPAASALAVYDPNNERWAKVVGPIASQLASVNPAYLEGWIEAMRPLRLKLVEPLCAVFRNQREENAARDLALSILVDYLSERGDLLADLIMDTNEKQFPLLRRNVESHGIQALVRLGRELDMNNSPTAMEAEKEHLARRQATAAVVLFNMGESGRVWPLLMHRSDPRVRNHLIHRLATFGADPQPLLRRLEVEKEPSIRRALLLSLGEFTTEQLPAHRRELLIPKLLQLYRSEPDPGLHASVEWLLRQWGRSEEIQRIDGELSLLRYSGQLGSAFAGRPLGLSLMYQNPKDHVLVPCRGEKGRGWYVNREGQSMVVIQGPVEFLMGSPPGEPGREEGPEGKSEAQHRRRISHSFAIATKEVTVQQFLRFRKDHKYDKQYAPTPNCPMNYVTWYEAAAYCNWLSQCEGVPEKEWCYLPEDRENFGKGVKLKPNYLQLVGYRLPSEAEWEFSCRAETLTCRAFGECDELLEKYAWYSKNTQQSHLRPVGQLKPNDLGLFDMLGNALEWCQESYAPYTSDADGRATEDIEDTRAVTDSLQRVLRGAAFGDGAKLLRSAVRARDHPSFRYIVVGFRPAKTCRSTGFPR